MSTKICIQTAMAGYQTCIVGRFGNNGPRGAEGFLIFVLTRSKRCNPSAPEEHLFEDDPGWLLPFEDDNFAALPTAEVQSLGKPQQGQTNYTLFLNGKSPKAGPLAST